MAARAGEEKLTGLQKAAVLLIALGPEKSASIFKHLKEEEIEKDDTSEKLDEIGKALEDLLK